MKQLTVLLCAVLAAGCAEQKAHYVMADSQQKATASDYQLATATQAQADTLPLLTANEYSRALVHELMSNRRIVDDSGMVGVTDFAYVDSALDQGSVLSNHLSEAIMYDLNKFGVPVLDYKVTDYIRVTSSGDFVLSRNFEELSAEMPIRYVVTGTMTAHKQGVLINARLIRIDNKQVMSAARTFMPEQVVRAIISKSGDDRLKLKQG